MTTSTAQLKTMTTTVFAPSGPVQRDSILAQAINNVRDTLPPVLDLKAKLTDGIKSDQGTDFVVEISYRERGVVDGKAQRAAATERTFTPGGTPNTVVLEGDGDADGDDAQDAELPAGNPAIDAALARLAPVDATAALAGADSGPE